MARVLLFCGGPTFYGKEIVTLRLAQALREKGWETEFITSHWNSPQVTARLQDSGIPCHFLWMGFISATLKYQPMLHTLGQLRKWPRLAYGFKRLSENSNIAPIIHTNWQHALLLLPILSPARDIFWLHESIPYKRRFVIVFRAIAKRVARIVCVSCAVARSVEALGIPRSKITVIYNGLPVPAPVSRQVSGDPLRVGIIGQIAPWKGHRELIDAVAILKQRGIQVLLRIYGTGPQEFVRALKERIAALKLDDWVEWCGFVSDSSAIYRSIDLCVVPSLSEEPLSTSAIEASAAGIPVVCSSRGGLPEIVEHDKTGLIVESGRPDLLAQALSTFVNQPDLLRTMGEAGRIRMLHDFSLEKFAAQFDKVLKETRCAGNDDRLVG